MSREDNDGFRAVQIFPVDRFSIGRRDSTATVAPGSELYRVECKGVSVMVTVTVDSGVIQEPRKRDYSRQKVRSSRGCLQHSHLRHGHQKVA